MEPETTNFLRRFADMLAEEMCDVRVGSRVVEMEYGDTTVCWDLKTGAFINDGEDA